MTNPGTDESGAVDGGPRPKVLVVDDEPRNLELLERSLHRKYAILTASSGEQALALLKTEPDVAIILCDYRMPQMSGTQLLAHSIQHVPNAKRVIITGYADVEAVIEAINHGQCHYFIRKPWNHQELDRTLEQLVHVHRLEAKNRELLVDLRRSNDELRSKEGLLARDLDERGRELLTVSSELERLNRELAVMAFRDGLTGLYNHRTFHERLREETARARRYHKPLSFIFCDIDHFKTLNDQFGHQLGDDVLRRVSEILRGEGSDHIRECDVVARYGGEEFVILLPETPKTGARILAERLCQIIRQTGFPGGLELTMSFGVAAFPEDAKNAEELLAFADHALFMAKQSGRNRVQLYSESLPATPSAPDKRPASPHRVGDIEASAAQIVDEFPTYHERVYAIVEALERERALGCLYVDLARVRRVELEYGVTRHNELLGKVGKVLGEIRGASARQSDLLCRAEGGDAFVYFLSAARQAGEELEAVSTRVQEAIDGALAREVFDLIHDHPRIAVGYARVLFNPMVRAERLVTRLVEDAKESASLMRKRQAQKDKDLLQELILGEGLTPVYQPIVHLDSGEIFGFEALTRGPHRSPLEAPIALFSVAEEVDLLFELDRACFRGCMRGAIGLEPVHRLFVNLLPLSFYDASFIETEVTTLLHAANLTPANVVFEITERLAIENFASFRKALAVYTGMGFGVAIDDVGTRHSNLEAVMALRPHIIKLSDVLTRGAAKSMVKREMLRSLGRISEAIDAVMVAEGIETPDDLIVLKELGVKYGQGYFLARPGAPFPRLRASVKRAVRALAAGSVSPIPAPPAEFDEEDGEFHEPTRPPEAPSLHPHAAHDMTGDGFDDETTGGGREPSDGGGKRDEEPVN